ncbi:secretory lipase-domain-containing protein [Truncatella angustata]|uniref:Secretory lipase-domain-containing protein n=1 Tax=Truncatella angustata TaxID=152316 RepID=A0A9P8UNX8_9PEZI|nr:secretory lipase-domain-containing protein [Truncatella angustata]KAH6655384.1 secretory lipase-domain-containing protein [Truncatella angustata]
MWGYSGGSLARSKAAELQIQFAPELLTGFVGAALGGLVDNLKAFYTVTNKTPYTGNLALSMMGIMSEFPMVDTYLRSRVKTKGSHNAIAFLKGREMDSRLYFYAYWGQNIYGYFVGGQAYLEGSQALRYDVNAQHERSTVCGQVSEILVETGLGEPVAKLSPSTGTSVNDVPAEIPTAGESNYCDGDITIVGPSIQVVVADDVEVFPDLLRSGKSQHVQVPTSGVPFGSVSTAWRPESEERECLDNLFHDTYAF